MGARLLSRLCRVAGLLRWSMWIAMANRIWLLFCIVRLPQLNTDIRAHTAA